MNLTPAAWKKSVVEENKQYVKKGMTLWYVDACNCNRYKVVTANENEMTLRDEEGHEDTLTFDGLQVGWEFSNKDLEYIEAVKR